MFFEPARNNHGLPHNPLKGLIIPRPIGWVSSRSANGVDNLAPYSFFNMINDRPPQLMFSSSGFKDSARNIAETRVFIVHIATEELFTPMNASSAPVAADVDEFVLAGLEKVEGTLVAASRIRSAPVALECVHVETLHLRDRNHHPTDNHMVIGELIGVHIDDALITAEGRVDSAKLKPLARLGWDEYGALGRVFRAPRP